MSDEPPPPPPEAPRMLPVGTRVNILPQPPVEEVRYGTVKFCGTTHFAPGPWCGIELDSKYKGKNDGSVQGTLYFTCVPGQGVFVRPELLSPENPNALPAVLAASTAKSGGSDFKTLELQGEIDMLKGELEERDATIARLQQEVEAATLDVEIAKEEHNATLDQLSALNLAAEYQGDTVALSREVEVLRNEIKKEQEEKEDFALTIGELKERLGAETQMDGNEMLEALTESKLELEERLASAEEQIASLQKEKEDLQNLVNMQEEELIEQRRFTDEVDGERGAEIEKIKAARDEVAALVSSLRSRLSELEKENEELLMIADEQGARLEASSSLKLRSEDDRFYANQRLERLEQFVCNDRTFVDVLEQERTALSTLRSSSIKSCLPLHHMANSFRFAFNHWEEISQTLLKPPPAPNGLPEDGLLRKDNGEVSTDAEWERMIRSTERRHRAVTISRLGARLSHYAARVDSLIQAHLDGEVAEEDLAKVLHSMLPAFSAFRKAARKLEVAALDNDAKVAEPLSNILTFFRDLDDVLPAGNDNSIVSALSNIALVNVIESCCDGLSALVEATTRAFSLHEKTEERHLVISKLVVQLRSVVLPVLQSKAEFATKVASLSSFEQVLTFADKLIEMYGKTRDLVATIYDASMDKFRGFAQDFDTATVSEAIAALATEAETHQAPFEEMQLVLQRYWNEWTREQREPVSTKALCEKMAAQHGSIEPSSPSSNPDGNADFSEESQQRLEAANRTIVELNHERDELRQNCARMQAKAELFESCRAELEAAATAKAKLEKLAKTQDTEYMDQFAKMDKELQRLKKELAATKEAKQRALEDNRPTLLAMERTQLEFTIAHYRRQTVLHSLDAMKSVVPEVSTYASTKKNWERTKRSVEELGEKMKAARDNCFLTFDD